MNPDAVPRRTSSQPTAGLPVGGLVFEPRRAVGEPLTLPLIGSSYPQVFRTPRTRWWHGVIAWVLVAVFALVAMIALVVVYSLVLYLTGGEDALAASAELDMSDPFTVFIINLTLVALIPLALGAIAIAYPVKVRFLHSVEGRVRWGWLVRCLVTLTPLWLLYLGVGAVLDGGVEVNLPDEWPALLAMAVLMTPLQAAGEEYLFRGFVLVTVGSWFRNPIVGLVASCVVSGALFGAAHGSPDPWILLALVGMAVACVYLSWRTGGLEAAIAIHVVNNVFAISLGILTGTVNEGYIDETTTGSMDAALISLLVSFLAAALLLWQARRAGITRTVPPAVGAVP